MESAQDKKIKVLYIGGWGRSGSTILGKILGQTDGFFLSGETRFFWKRGLLENWYCGCGLPFHECFTWQEIVRQTAFDKEDVEQMLLFIDRLKAKSLFFKAGLMREIILSGAFGQLTNLYTSMTGVTGARVIVDTSKHPGYAWMLNQTPGLEIYLLHLVRDPRGVANSWAKKNLDTRGNRSTMAHYNFFQSTRQWLAWNMLYENIKTDFPERYLFMRYEDFVQRPQAHLAHIFEFLGEPNQHLINDQKDTFLKPTHTLSGNYNRFETGIVRLTPDDDWIRNMNKYHKSIISLLAFPLMLKYHYKF